MSSSPVKITSWICDIETMVNLSMFNFVDYNRKSTERHSFVLWKHLNDLPELYIFLERNIQHQERHVTYNGLGFDSQIIQWLIDNKQRFLSLDTSTVISMIYKYAQSCIQKSRDGKWQDYPPWKIQIPQLDLMKMGHWGAEDAKPASLKWLQCAIDWHNVEDMPYSHTDYIDTIAKVEEIRSYCYNDCDSTKEILYIAKDAVRLRKDLSEAYDIDLWSASEPRMSKELFLYFLAKKLGRDKQDLKQWSTAREWIQVKDIILPNVRFQRQEFIMLLNNFKKLSVRGDSLKGSFKYNVKYRGISIDYGVGGIHGMTSKGVYKSEGNRVIKSVDVKSFYPNLCIQNGWAPAHINKKAFCEQYLWFYEERTKHKKGTAQNKALKILLNATFGLSIDKNSFLSDPQLGVSITINGQLLLTMLLEMICERFPNATPLVMNTDGLEVMIDKKDEAEFVKVCEEWEKMTKLELEYDEYDTILAYDCNNYIGLFKNGKLKGKGRFEYEPHDKYDLDVLHKNKSFLVVPKALAAYFFKGTDPMEYIKAHRNIFDFCGYARARGAWKFIKISHSADGVTEEPISKTLRYFVSKSGCKVTKRKIEGIVIEDGDGEHEAEKQKNTLVLAGKTYLTPFNKFEKLENWDDYNVDYDFYLREVNKEIRALKKTQTKIQFEKSQTELSFE